MPVHYLLSLSDTRKIDNAYLRRIIFFMFLINLRVKSPIAKTKENNIFEYMTYQFV